MGERKIEHQSLPPNRAQGVTPSGQEVALVTPLSLTDGGLPRLHELKHRKRVKDLLDSAKIDPAPLASLFGSEGESISPTLGRVAK